MLKVNNVSKFFGSLAAVDNVSLDVNKGELLALIGPNGAGKTTLLRLIMNIYKPSSGIIEFEGKKINGLTPHRTCKLGICMTNQIPAPFHRMTCLENVIVGGVFGAGLSIENARREAEKILGYVLLSEYRDVVASNLTHLQQKLLEFAKALSIKPKLLLIDEPLAGLTEKEIHPITSLIKRLHNEGMTILWVEHVISEVEKYAERIVVLNEGKKLIEGNPKEVIRDKRFIEAYLGEETC
ncbi:MAG: ABC transporter ATP-binding protein [Candidatus Bathyarchaeia archaeon]